MELTLFPLSSLVILIIYFILQKQRKRFSPPGPAGLPFIGNMLQLDTSKPHECFRLLSLKYGPLMSIKLGTRKSVVVSSSRIAKEVMQKQDHLCCNRPNLLGMKKLSYNGLDMGFAPYNESSRQMKKIAVFHLLSTKRVQSLRSVREDEVSRMIKKISKAASLSKITNLSEAAISLTNTLICRVAFGKRYDKEDQERRNFFTLIDKAEGIAVGFLFSDYFPLIGWAVDKITGAITHIDDICDKLDLVFQELIDNHLDINRPKSMENDFIDILLQIREDKSTAIDLTMGHIKGVLMNVFLGGTATSSAAIIWVMTSLSKSPSEMKKVQEEIRNVMGKKEMLNEDDCQKLPYLKAVIKETLRLFPPVPLSIPRETMDKCIIDGYEIQAGTMINVNIWAIGRDPEVWEKPDEFLPERFLNSNIDVKGQDFVMIPFGGGRRGCPGVSMGLATLELVLANLLYLFDWSLPFGMKEEDIDIEALPGISTTKKNPLLLQANKIN